MRPRVAVLASGMGQTLAALLRASAPDSSGPALDADIALVISNRSRCGAARRAHEHGVPFRHLSAQTHSEEDALDAAMHAALRAARIDWIVLAGYLKKLGPQVLTTWSGRMLNTHPALLPRFGGAGMYGRQVHEAVLASGATLSGASVHYVTAEYDTGPVIAQVEVPVCPDDDADALEARVKDAEQVLLVRVLNERAHAPVLDLSRLPVVTGYVVQPAMPRHLCAAHALGDAALARAQAAGRLWAVLDAQDAPLLLASVAAVPPALGLLRGTLRGTLHAVVSPPPAAELTAMLDGYIKEEALRLGYGGATLAAAVAAT